MPSTVKVASLAVTLAPTVASDSAGLTTTTTGGQLQVTGSANMMSVSRVVAMFTVLLGAVVLF